MGNCLAQRVTRTRIRNACDPHSSFFEIGRTNVCNTMFGDNDVNIALRRSDVAAGNARHDTTLITALIGRWQGKDRQAACRSARRPEIVRLTTRCANVTLTQKFGIHLSAQVDLDARIYGHKR